VLERVVLLRFVGDLVVKFDDQDFLTDVLALVVSVQPLLVTCTFVQVAKFFESFIQVHFCFSVFPVGLDFDLRIRRGLGVVMASSWVLKE
jgi:hypothetical protein